MKIKIFTDGACSGNPGPGGAAMIAITDSNQVYEASGGYRITTNNRMEMTAAIKGLEFAETLISNARKRGENEFTVTILSDSQIIVGTMNNGWKRKKNNDLWQKMDGIVESLRGQGVNLYFLKVQAHHNVKYNEQADRLAVKACKDPAYVDYVYEKENENETV